MSGWACSIAAKAVWALSGSQSAACSATTWIFGVLLDAVLEAVEPLDGRGRARQALEHRDLAAVRQQRLGGVFAGLQGDLVVVAADEGRVVLAGIADRLAVELDHRECRRPSPASPPGVSGAASNGEISSRSTFWVMKLSTCEVCVLTLPAPSAICRVNCGTCLGGGGQFVVDVLAIGLGVVGLARSR